MRETQRDKILRLLQERHGDWVPLPEILALGAAQYGARILELRRQGFQIQNRTEHRNGKVHSWFRIPLEQQRGLFAHLPARGQASPYPD